MKKSIQGIDHIFVVSAPSGTGKTSLNKRLMQNHTQYKIATSHTTRSKRGDEVNHIDFHFVHHQDFKKLIADGEMIEWANVFGEFYGTSKKMIENEIKDGFKPILEIDVQGYQQIKNSIKNQKSIFILPPSIEDLWLRLENRGTDSFDKRWRRINTSTNEMKFSFLYDYFIINDDFESAYKHLEDIIIKNDTSKLITKAQGIAHCEKLISEFKSSELLNSLRPKKS